ncbi:MAG: hypothetical protein E7220_04975, partial [Clostridiales bacterium]|nr:hypothetical protein [Clostridiales bacterium]
LLTPLTGVPSSARSKLLAPSVTCWYSLTCSPITEDGTPVKGVKRHPNIGNNVVIYAGATILGGDTSIGDDCVVGGNVWLTHSLEAGKTITNKSSGQQLYQGRREVESGNVILNADNSALFI